MCYTHYEKVVFELTKGELIRKARKDAGLTQKQLGEKSGIAEPTIRRYELGKLNPKIETLQKIARALNISVNELMGTHVETNEGHLYFMGENFPENEMKPYLEIPSNEEMLQELLKAYNNLNWYGQNLVVEFARNTATIDNCKKECKPTLCVYPESYKKQTVTEKDYKHMDEMWENAQKVNISDDKGKK